MLTINKMSKNNLETKLCPVFQKPAEVGCLLGNPNYNSIADNGLTWFQGEHMYLEKYVSAFRKRRTARKMGSVYRFEHKKEYVVITVKR